jgi:23S rRNA pseudouridine955/2504/2580 synthase
MVKRMIIYENDDFICINKPNGLASQGGDNVSVHVEELLQRYIGVKSSIFLLHRLDKYCSGVMVLGKNVHYARTFGGLMKEKRIYKTYYAL